MTLNKAKVESPNGKAKLAHSTVLFIGSDVIGRGELEAQGVEILACGTYLSRFQLTDKVKVGKVTDMYTIADTMFKAGKVVSL